MRPPSGDWRWDANAGSLTASEDLFRLLPTPRTKPDDYPVGTNARSPEPPLVFGSPDAARNIEALDDLFSRPQAPRHASSLPQQTNNSAQAAASGGVAGGASTPNTGAGGSGASSSGAGPAVTNANQFLSAYLNMVGSALPAGTVPALATPAAHGQPVAAAAGHHAAAAGIAATRTLTPATASAPAASLVVVKKRHDPLYVLDLNTGETVPANVTLNTFSSWSENLLAQVSGGTVSSYQWNTTQAPDFTVNGGTTSASLQGSWNSFIGSARTDTISVTETPQGGQPLTQTITFLVAGTDSPAFAASRPTSSATWPSVLSPDKLSSGQATQTAGPDASIGLADGSVQTTFSMPDYNPNTTPVSLDYSSTAANAQPIFLAEYQLPFGQAVPATITAQLTSNNVAGSTVYYNTSGLNPGDWVQMALQANAASLSTGRYPWQITVTNGTATTYSGNVNIVNQSSSPFGAGWSLDSVETLVPVTGGVILVKPDGTSLWFANGATAGTFTTPAGDFSTLTQNTTTGVYTRKLTDGTAINFDSTGKQTSIVDRDGNTTTFGYTGGLLTSITDLNNQVTTLTYTAGKLTSITDPANRKATLAYTGSQLISITDPANDVWGYTYDSANDLTKLTDPNTHATTFAYNFAGRVSSVTRADLTTEQLTPVQINGLAAPGTGTQASPATAVLLAAGDTAQFTDGNNNVWATGLDWLGYGSSVQDADPLADTSLTYIDANGLAWLSANPLAFRTREFFDTSGNPTKIVNPDDTFAQYSYNSFSEPTQYTDELGHVTTYVYNTKGDLTQETNALLHTTTYAYNAAGLVTSMTNARLFTWTYTYDALNRKTGETDPLLHTQSWAYDSAGNLTSYTNQNGAVSTYAYDAMGRKTGETLPDSGLTTSTYTFTYDKVGNQTSQVVPLTATQTATTTSTYDALNRLSSVTDPLLNVTRYGYDNNGNETGVTNGLGFTTTYQYDAANRQTAMIIPISGSGPGQVTATTTFGYDLAGEQTSKTDALNDVWNYSYNNRGWLSSATDPNNNQTTYGYDAVGERTSESQMSGGVVVYHTNTTYDAIGEVTQVTDNVGGITTYTYDAVGNRTAIQGVGGCDCGCGGNMTFGYNAGNQQTTMTDAAGDVTTTVYDGVGNKTQVTDPLGHATTFGYDGQNRLLSVTNALTGKTSYAYNLAGWQTSETDPDNNVTQYGYNAAGETTSETNPLNFTQTFSYDAAGRLTAKTDYNGQQTQYAYNESGWKTGETWLNSLNQTIYQATFTYDNAGRLTAEQDGNSLYSYTYNNAGEMTQDVVTYPGVSSLPLVTLTFGYDAFGNRTSLSDSMLGAASYSFDGQHHLTRASLQVNGLPGPIVALSYDGTERLQTITRSVGPQTVTYDTITSTYTYDTANRLTNLVHTDTTKLITLANYTYGYNAASQVTSYQDANSSLTYGYDNTGQLTSAAGTLNGSTYSKNYSYDANGNRNMVGYQTGTGNQLLNDGTFTYTYDKNGNTLTKTNTATGDKWTYTWDYHNRLTEAVESVGASNDERFTYDVEGRLIGVSLNGTQQRWTVFDGANPYMDFNGAGTSVAERYLTDPQSMGVIFARVSGSGSTIDWYLTDRLGSVRLNVDTLGNVLDSIYYDAFGNIPQNGESNPSNGDRFKYAGGQYDSIQAAYLFWHRWYLPGSGRWASPDPLGLRPDVNPYRYVSNDPLGAIDPTGKVLIRILADWTFNGDGDYWQSPEKAETYAADSGFTGEINVKPTYGWCWIHTDGKETASIIMSFERHPGGMLLPPGRYSLKFDLYSSAYNSPPSTGSATASWHIPGSKPVNITASTSSSTATNNGTSVIDTASTPVAFPVTFTVVLRRPRKRVVFAVGNLDASANGSWQNYSSAEDKISIVKKIAP